MLCRKCGTELTAVVLRDAYGSEQNMLICGECHLDFRSADTAQFEPAMSHNERQSYRAIVWNKLNGAEVVQDGEKILQDGGGKRDDQGRRTAAAPVGNPAGKTSRRRGARQAAA